MYDGTANIEGNEISDKLYFDLEGKLSLKFPMIGSKLVKNATWMASDGVFGLGRGENGRSKTLDALFDASLISNKMFTLSLDNPNVDSHLIIGGIPPHIVFENITWNELTDKELW